MNTERVTCVNNEGYPVSLILNSVYEALPDDDAAKRNLIRVIDESGKDYLYPADFFSSCDAGGQAFGERIEAYFRRAQESFDRNDPLEGSETLADAVRVELRCIATERGWPHNSDDDLYRAAAALATGGGIPGETDNLYILLDEASNEGMDLCGALAASLGRPDAVRHGLYGESLENVQDDATLFARKAINLARRLAKGEVATS